MPRHAIKLNNAKCLVLSMSWKIIDKISAAYFRIMKPSTRKEEKEIIWDLDTRVTVQCPVPREKILMEWNQHKPWWVLL